MQLKMSGHYGNDKNTKTPMEWHFPTITSPTEKKSKPTIHVWYAASMMREEKLYTIVRTAMSLYMRKGVSRLTTSLKVSN